MAGKGKAVPVTEVEVVPLVAPMAVTRWGDHDPLEDTDAAAELACGCLPGRAHGTRCDLGVAAGEV
jgi:hypothetical protein